MLICFDFLGIGNWLFRFNGNYLFEINMCYISDCDYNIMYIYDN